jgi:uncharacterized protein YjbI with pentapeptide repeats
MVPILVRQIFARPIFARRTFSGRTCGTPIYRKQTLKELIFQGAYLGGSNLYRARLFGTNLSGARATSETKWRMCSTLRLKV